MHREIYNASSFVILLDQELISYRYSSCSSCCWGDSL